MSERTRELLKPEFRDGERPSGADFADLIDSCVNKATDGVAFDTDGNLLLNRGVRLGNSNGTAAGGLRFNNTTNQLQVFNGTAWVDVSSGGGGAFQPPPTDPAAVAVAHNGNVGIGTFSVAAPPTFRLEVPLPVNGGPGDQVRFGNAVLANGQGAFGGFAAFSHQNHANNSNYAIRQSSTGAVHINAAPGPAGTFQVVSIRQGGANVRLGVSATGNVVIANENDLAGAPAGSTLQVQGNAHIQGDINVTGAATKPLGGTWTPSDARIKDHVRDLEFGLAELLRVRTVRFRYNGRGGVPAGRPDIGVIGQEIEAVIPDTVRHVSVPDDPELHDMRLFDASALTFVLINAVKELAARVEYLEQALEAATTAPVIA